MTSRLRLTIRRVVPTSVRSGFRKAIGPAADREPAVGEASLGRLLRPAVPRDGVGEVLPLRLLGSRGGDDSECEQGKENGRGIEGADWLAD